MKKLLAAAAGICTVALAAPAAAQMGTALDQGTFAVRFGIYSPFEQNLRDLDEIWFAGGLDFEVNKALLKNAVSVISVDWLTFNGGARNQAIPITFNQRIYRAGGANRVYFQGGIGVAVLDFGFSDNVLCLRAGLGMEFNASNFAEVNFIWVDSETAGSDATGVTLQYGIHF